MPARSAANGSPAPDGASAPLRSQAANKERAFAILRARLFEAELQKQQEEIRAKRMSQVGLRV